MSSSSELTGLFHRDRPPTEDGAFLAARMPMVRAAALALLGSPPRGPRAARAARYELERELGAGGQAEVLLGTVRGAEGFHRRIAVKRVRSDRAGAGWSAAHLIEEAHLASRLSHPNVVSVLDLDRDAAGRLFLVMEYVDGVDLGRLLEAGPVPRGVAIFVVRELLAGLGYLHELRARGGVRGLIHRDVTPPNVLLSWEGAIKLADFGLAQELEGATTVGASTRAGTAGYMSPEQARGGELDGRSDLYAAGIVLRELLGPARGVPPADLEAISLRLLAHDREARYRTAELAAHDLLRCRDAPRDGRAELVRLLDERFPRARRRRPSSRPPARGTRSPGVRTLTAPSPPRRAAPSPGPWPGPGAPWPQPRPRARRQEAGPRRAATPPRSRWRSRSLACGVLLALALALALALLVAR